MKGKLLSQSSKDRASAHESSSKDICPASLGGTC
jgi:hypothetical protein